MIIMKCERAYIKALGMPFHFLKRVNVYEFALSVALIALILELI